LVNLRDKVKVSLRAVVLQRLDLHLQRHKRVLQTSTTSTTIYRFRDFHIPV
jgi:hypothetical protein